MMENDKYLKDMWNKAENLLGSSEYERSTIERFISKRSNSTAEKIKKMIYMDIFLKSVFLLVLIVDIFLYTGTANVIAVCITSIALLIPLILFEFKMLSRFSKIIDYGQSTKQKLAAMLTYLRSEFFSTLLAISIGYPFMFIAGMLVYFYSVYGRVRPLDGQDIIVFSTIIIAGLAFNFYINRKQVDYQIKHLETCLSDLNDSSLQMVSDNLERQRKQDMTNKVLLFIVLIFGFVLLLVIFKNIGFLIH
ncbi:MAG: hypothetical protein R3182_04770 [Draconibacterium sp.]|nr:hypothetical protein [Draconibacterium sp.]